MSQKWLYPCLAISVVLGTVMADSPAPSQGRDDPIGKLKKTSTFDRAQRVNVGKSNKGKLACFLEDEGSDSTLYIGISPEGAFIRVESGPDRLANESNFNPTLPLVTRTNPKPPLRIFSERMINDALSWMYGGNRQHHIVGLVKGKAPGLHHYSFEFPDFSMYCMLGDILDQYDRQMMWGPGRHRPGDNTYAYYLDSSGCMVECAGPMATVADDALFEARIITNLARPGNVRDMNVWGSPAPLEWREHFFPFQPLP